MIDINFNPLTLQEESEEEARIRRRQTGVIGNGHEVLCYPTGDPNVVEYQNRATCLTRPYQACDGCIHSNFTLVFNADSDAKFEQVKCPKWKNGLFPSLDELPSHYDTTEVATCKEKPFPFCSSCPSLERLSQLYIDKKKDGWYSRLKRFGRYKEEHDE